MIKENEDPLLKLKEERDKLIQWSKKIKNSNIIYSNSDILNKEKSFNDINDESLNIMNRNKEYDNSINKVKYSNNKSKINSNESRNKSYIKDKTNEYDEDDSILVKLKSRINKSNNYDKSYEYEYSNEINNSYKNVYENLQTNKEINKRKNIFESYINSDEENNLTNENIFYNMIDNMKIKSEIPKKSIKQNIFLDSNDIFMDNKTSSSNNYPANISNIKIKESICKLIKKDNKNTIEGAYENSDLYDKISKKTIKVKRNKHNISDENNKIYSNKKREYVDKENKSSNESMKTYIKPITSNTTSIDTSFCTTYNSNNEADEIKNVSNIDIMENDNSNKIFEDHTKNMLKKKVETLEKKKEILNDRINDIKDNVYSLMDSKKKDNLTVHHYEALIKNMEFKYNRLFNMYQELDEHRISYVEAYREKQTKIENLCASLQIKTEENLKISKEMAIYKKKIEVLQGEIYEYKKDIEEKDKQLIEKKQEIALLKEQVAELNKEINRLNDEVKKMTNELNDIKDKNNLLNEQNVKIQDDYSYLVTKYNTINDFYISKFNNLQGILKTLLSVFNMNNEYIENFKNFFNEHADLIHKKLEENDSTYEEIINILNQNIIDPIKNVIIDREKEHVEQKKIMENEFDEQILKMYETNIKNIEMAENQIQQLKEKLANTINQREVIKKRAILLSNGQGRLNDKSVVADIKKLKEGTQMYKCKYYTLTHKPVLIYMKLINNEELTWTKDKTGVKGFKKRKLLNLQDIISIDYGVYSRIVYWHIEKANMKKLQKEKIEANQFYDNKYEIDPYKCFTINTRKRAYDFYSRDENIIANWVIGLGRLCSQYTKYPNIQSRSEFIVKKVQLKLKLYCLKNNITYTELWKDAINLTKRQKNIEN